MTRPEPQAFHGIAGGSDTGPRDQTRVLIRGSDMTSRQHGECERGRTFGGGVSLAVVALCVLLFALYVLEHRDAARLLVDWLTGR
ncbi:MAG: hypothetical protein ABIG03_01440 [Candidatus Eisenbacteria bacterium]